jgi:endonuclease-8
VPEGDAVHRAARRLQALVGEELDVETPHPRAAVKQLAPALDGRRLEAVEAIGKNLLLRFEGGVVLRNHMRMKGRWRVLSRDAEIFGTPWLVLRGERHVGVLSGGAVLELERREPLRVGPDILADPPDFDAMLRNLRAVEQTREVGDALLAQYLVAGIGNIWKVESLWAVGVSPWAALADVSDDELRAVLHEAHRLMKASLDGTLVRRNIYRRPRQGCPRCGTQIRSWPQGDGARMAYWCPHCQQGKEPPMK